MVTKQDLIDKWNELKEMDLDDFYTNGKIDIEKIQTNDLTRFIKSAAFKDGQMVSCKLRNDYSGYVYIITSEIGLTKIGKTEDVKKRLSQIDGASPCKVDLYHCQFVKNSKEVESILHKRFRDKRVKGEWFNLDNEEIKIAQKLIDEYEWKKQKRS